MIKSCLLCGVGGQGTVLAAKVFADAAIAKGEEVKTTETIGMSQRGGSVVSHVRTGENIHSPLIPMKGADLIIGFEPGEVVRNLPYLKPDGVIVVSPKAIKPVTASLSGASYEGEDMIDYLKQMAKLVIVVDTQAICEACGSTKVLNVALLGAAAMTGKMNVTAEEIKSALLKRLPEKFHLLNEMALELGMKSISDNNNVEVTV